MKFFDGKLHAQKLEQQIISYIHSGGYNGGVLLLVMVGEDSASKKYVALKKKFCEQVGIKCEVLNVPATDSDEEIASQLKLAFDRRDVSGGIVQLPLPRASLYEILGQLPAEKDVDVLADQQDIRIPPVVRAFDYFCQLYGVDLTSTKVAVVGLGRLVGKPIYRFAKAKGADVFAIENYTKGMQIDAELVVLSAGLPNLVAGEDLNLGVHVIDFGVSVDPVTGAIVGDLDLKSDVSKLGVVSPAVGGMGPLVVRYLIMNFLGL